MTLEDSVLRHRLAVLQRAAALGNVSQACREFGISRALFYRWRTRFTRYGRDGLRPRADPAQPVAPLSQRRPWSTRSWPTPCCGRPSARCASRPNCASPAGVGGR